ncbi:MAG TPA: hemerythrin domain-containing protein [Intrasporangium sp.]|nr:hemerythrin domain-containing protein [Intrasporangium sp.]
MTDRETIRLVAWSQELRRVHARLRSALDLTRDALKNGTAGADLSSDLLLYCRGFCAALDGHHEGEDRTLFPAIEAAHPHLGPVLRKLEQDHSMIAHLLGQLRAALDRAASPGELHGHLEGVAAIMESHFRYEERQLLTVLKTLELHADATEVLGPL